MHPVLTTLGRRQAARAAAVIQADLAHRFGVTRDDGAVTVVTSDLARAVQTAEIIAQRLRLPSPPRMDPRLREQALGRLEGKGYAATRKTSESIDWSDSDVQVGGGESARQVYARMAEALAGLPGEHVSVVVSHGDAIRYALGWSGGYSPAQCPGVAIANGAVVALDGSGDPPRILVTPAEARRLDALPPT
ncbi:MAG: histidine phosphatase family protein [Steroidobacteraceae bacterium]